MFTDSQYSADKMHSVIPHVFLLHCDTECTYMFQSIRIIVVVWEKVTNYIAET